MIISVVFELYIPQCGRQIKGNEVVPVGDLKITQGHCLNFCDNNNISININNSSSSVLTKYKSTINKSTIYSPSYVIVH